MALKDRLPRLQYPLAMLRRFTLGLLCFGLAFPSFAAARKPSPPAKKPPSKTATPPPHQVTLLKFPKDSTVIRQKKPLKGIKPGAVLKVGDLIRTGKTGSVDIRHGDQGVLRLKPNSQLLAKTLLKQSVNDPLTRDSRLRLERGTLLTRLGRLSGKSRFLVESRSMVMAAKGTRFLVEFRAKDTRLLVSEGTVAVTLAGADEQSLDVGAEQKVELEKALPAESQPLDAADRKRLSEIDTLAASIERETTPMLGVIDRHLAAANYGDAERLAWYVVRRAWGSKNSIRAHGRLLQSFRQQGKSFLEYDPRSDFRGTLVAMRGFPSQPSGRDVLELLDFVASQFPRGDASRETALAAASFTFGLGPTLEEWEEILNRFENEGVFVTSAIRSHYAVAVLASKSDPSWNPQLEAKMWRWLEELADETLADPYVRISSAERLHFVGSPSPRNNDRGWMELIDMAKGMRSNIKHYFIAAAALRMRQKRFDIAEQHLKAVLDQSSSGVNSVNVVFLFNAAAFEYRAVGNAERERYWREVIVKSFYDVDQEITRECVERLRDLR